MAVVDSTPGTQSPSPADAAAGAGASMSAEADHISCAGDFDSARCKALMRVLTSIVWVTDAKGRFTAPQPSWSSYTGQSWAEQQGLGWLNAIHPDDREPVRSTLAAARERRSAHFSSGRLWHAATHAYRRVEARGVPILDAQGDLKEWVGTCKDVEDLVIAEEALRDSDRRKDEFIAILGHELRNPLAPIRNAAHLLKVRGDSQDVQLNWARAVIERQVDRMAHLLDDLLDVSKISQNKVELHKERVTLESILDSAIEVSQPQWQKQGQHFEFDVQDGPIYIEADAARLAQAFTNLLNNAAKYTDAGGHIRLSAAREGELAVVNVEDDGMGISPQMLPRLFDLFSQAPSAIERSQGGLGIGLSVVQALVQMHGGSVEAHSDGLGRGSRFTVRLPAAPQRLAQRPPAQPQEAGVPRLKLLVADDNADAAETLSVLLEMFGHVVQVAQDGDQALEVARWFVPDAALLDIGMPKRDGYAVAQELKALQPQITLVAITGWGQKADMTRSVEAGFDYHLVKPVDADRLAGILAQIAPASKAAGG